MNLTTPSAVMSETLQPFDFDPRTRICFGNGALEHLGKIASQLGPKRVLLVTDPGLSEAGHAQRAVKSLEDHQLSVVVYDQVTPNPTTEDVETALKVAQQAQVELIIGLGGGSSMDCAKGVNFLITNGGSMHDYRGVGKATKPMLPMIAIPTTSGTGSEAQSFAVIADAKTHMKMPCGDKKAAAKVAILDPELTVTMPRSITSVTGIDAISHALETFVTLKRNEISNMYAMRAWKLLSQSFARVLEEPTDLNARGEMLWGAHLAGAAIENSMLGATHALANPMSAHFNTTHGVAIGLMLPHVIRFNAAEVGPLYGQLAEVAGLCSADDSQAAEKLADYVAEMVRLTGNPQTLAEAGVEETLIATMAAEAAQQWTGTFNPRSLSPELLEEIYRCAM